MISEITLITLKKKCNYNSSNNNKQEKIKFRKFIVNEEWSNKITE